MAFIFTRHAKKRMKKRGIGSGPALRAVSGQTKYLGAGKYKSVKRSMGKSLTVVYKKEKGKKIALTVWKNSL